MGSYRQFCPIARGSEIVAERWTPVILRNLLEGARTFNEIAAGASGLSRALLTRRLAELDRVGLITKQPKPDGHGFRYTPTPAGYATEGVLAAIAQWAQDWVEVRPEHCDIGLVLSQWCRTSLRCDRLPGHRVVVRFDFVQRGRRTRSWMLLRDGDAEICNFDPGFGEDLFVQVHDATLFTRWHLGEVSWSAVLRSNAVTMTGPSSLRRALPTWHAAPTRGGDRTRPDRGALEGPNPLALKGRVPVAISPRGWTGAGTRRS
jgi:DNA-binding HxlR family transcriptional regulator